MCSVMNFVDILFHIQPLDKFCGLLALLFFCGSIFANWIIFVAFWLFFVSVALSFAMWKSSVAFWLFSVVVALSLPKGYLLWPLALFRCCGVIFCHVDIYLLMTGVNT